MRILPTLKDRIRLRNVTDKIIRLRFNHDRYRLEPGEHVVIGGGWISFTTQEVEVVEVLERKKRKHPSDRERIRRIYGPWKE